MTDFSRSDPITVHPQTSIDAAYEHMKVQGVRCALISNGDGRVLGYVSAADIQGEGPMRLQQERSLPRSHVTVSDIMVRLDQIPAIHLADIAYARVGDLTQTFKQVGRHHVLVMNDDQEGYPTVCGMFSSRDIARALGVELTPSLQATTFAALWQALAS
jgi:CBS domain-containing protein